VTPSVNEQHSPLPDASLLNHPFNSGRLGSWASAGAITIEKNIPKNIPSTRFCGPFITVSLAPRLVEASVSQP
jgi:hypothetical protein